MLGTSGFRGCQESEPSLFINNGVITGESADMPVPDQIATGIADMSHDSPVETETARDERRRHGNSARTSRHPGLINLGVGALNELRHERGQRLAAWGLT